MVGLLYWLCIKYILGTGINCAFLVRKTLKNSGSSHDFENLFFHRQYTHCEAGHVSLIGGTKPISPTNKDINLHSHYSFRGLKKLNL